MTCTSLSSNFVLYPEVLRSSDFALYLQHHTFTIMSQYDMKVDLKVSVGHSDISWSSDFALYMYLEIYLICKYHTFFNMSQYDPKFDLKINVGHNDLPFTVE